MKKDIIISHYSKALFNLAPTGDKLKEELSILHDIIKTIDDNVTLNQLLSNPSVDKQKKKNILKGIFQEKVDNKLLHFLSLLIDKGRFNFLSEIVENYELLVKRKLNTLTAQLITAVPIENSIVKKVQDNLAKHYKQDVELLTLINPQIIGGIILMVDHQMVDLSVKNRLNQIKQELLLESVLKV